MFKRGCKTKIISFIFLATFMLTFLSSCGKSEEEYTKELSDFTKEVATLAVRSEEVGSEFVDVWHEAIFEDYVFVDETMYTDFNDALAAQNDFFETEGNFSTIENQEKKVKESYKAIKENKVASMNDEFDSVKEFYLKTIEFKDLCINPTGSYDSYSESYRDKQAEVSAKISSLTAELDIDEE
ncbi:MAG: hypothetical protein ACLTXM_09205 [Enterococcus sp.]